MTPQLDAASPLAWLAAAHMAPASLLLGWIEARFIARRVRLKDHRRLWLALTAGNCAAAWSAWALLHLDGWPLQAAIHHTPWAWLRWVLTAAVPLTFAAMLGVEALFLLPFARPARVPNRKTRRAWWRAFLHANLLTGVPLFALYGLLSSHSLLWHTHPVGARRSGLLDGPRFTLFLVRDGGRVATLDLPSLAQRELATLDRSLADPVFRFATDAAPGTTLHLTDAARPSVLRTPVHVFQPGEQLPAMTATSPLTIHAYLTDPAGEGPRFAGATTTAATTRTAATGFSAAGRTLALASPLLALPPREAFVLPDDRLLLLAGDRLLLADPAAQRTTEIARARRVLPVLHAGGR